MSLTEEKTPRKSDAAEAAASQTRLAGAAQVAAARRAPGEANRAAMLKQYKPHALFKGKGKALSPQKEQAAHAVPESAPAATTTAKKRIPCDVNSA